MDVDLYHEKEEKYLIIDLDNGLITQEEFEQQIQKLSRECIAIKDEQIRIIDSVNNKKPT